MSADYIQQTKGFVTASKLKEFIKSPEAYFRKYILETPLAEKESKAFLIGTAFDDYLSYGQDFFFDKYFIDSWMLVADMVRECGERGIIVESKESRESLVKKLFGDVSQKIRLTAWEGETVLGMIAEAKRQPLWDLEGGYVAQQEVTAVFQDNLKLKGRLDRFSLEKKLIRDFKTTSDVTKFQGELASKFGYEISMAFYYLLVKISYWVECDVILDVVQSSAPYASEVFGYKKDRLELIIGSTIIPVLETLKQMTDLWEETGDETVWTQPVDRHNLFYLDSYPILETAKQEDITFISF